MAPRAFLVQLASVTHIDILPQSPKNTRRWKRLQVEGDQVIITPEQAQRARIFLRDDAPPVDIYLHDRGTHLENEVLVPITLNITFEDKEGMTDCVGRDRNHLIYHTGFPVADGAAFFTHGANGEGTPFMFVGGKESKL